MEMESEKQEFSKDNPFKTMNPATTPAIIWEKINDVEKVTIENKTDIKWLKKEYAVQICFTVATFLTLIGFICKYLM